jgi:acyl-CoA hydrolase
MVVGDGLGVPRSAPAALLSDFEAVVGWMPVVPQWTKRLEQALTVMGGRAARELVASGRLSYLPVRYSALPRLLTGLLRPAVAVIPARPDPGGLRFGLEVGYARIAAMAAERVVVEVDPGLPLVPGAPLLERRDVEVVEAESAAPELEADDASPVDAEIGSRIAELVPEGATVQYGPGGVGDAAIRALAVRVRVHSGMVTDALADLAHRGLLAGRATAAYMLGGSPLRDLAEAGEITLRGVEETHSAGALARLERFVAINAALSVGLDGAVNVERAGGQLVGGAGGHPDFCAAAAASPGGLSIVGLRSSRGGHSNIVPAAAPVTTPRSDVDLVVTEHGVADLRGLDDRRRAAALIAVADPSLREALERAAAG